MKRTAKDNESSTAAAPSQQARQQKRSQPDDGFPTAESAASPIVDGGAASANPPAPAADNAVGEAGTRSNKAPRVDRGPAGAIPSVAQQQSSDNSMLPREAVSDRRGSDTLIGLPPMTTLSPHTSLGSGSDVAAATTATANLHRLTANEAAFATLLAASQQDASSNATAAQIRSWMNPPVPGSSNLVGGGGGGGGGGAGVASSAASINNAASLQQQPAVPPDLAADYLRVQDALNRLGGANPTLPTPGLQRGLSASGYPNLANTGSLHAELMEAASLELAARGQAPSFAFQGGGLTPLAAPLGNASDAASLVNAYQILQHRNAAASLALSRGLQGAPGYNVPLQLPLTTSPSSLHGAGSLYGSTQQARDLLSLSRGGPRLSTLPALLAQPEDNLKLSRHQVLLREQIEAFQATDDDVSTHTRGRNKPVVIGQVGIRCRHCSHLPVARKQKGSTYFPASLLGLYQAAQNMSTTHMTPGLCSEMPDEIKTQFAQLLATKVATSGGGRPYWASSARKLGLVDTETGIRFIHNIPAGTKLIEPQPRTTKA